MADLQTLHTQAKKLILTIRAGLERLETAEQVPWQGWIGSTIMCWLAPAPRSCSKWAV